MDVVKVNSVHFLATYSYTVKFCTTTELKSAKIPTIIKILTSIIAVHSVRGFSITTVAADNKFALMSQNPDFINPRIILNVTSEDEHEPYIE